ncbi:hypothetical protein AB0D78_18710 [Streptomyces avermitilis]|uniref:hypothetical protein n=1 Tax=Streptomyces avermitilis TaxID=33903 RepID=UPI0033EDC798
MEVIAASAQRGITLIAPIIVSTGRNARAGTFTPADFTVDWQANAARCPAGALSRSMKEDGRGLNQVRVLPERLRVLPGP